MLYLVGRIMSIKYNTYEDSCERLTLEGKTLACQPSTKLPVHCDKLVSYQLSIKLDFDILTTKDVRV